MLNDVIVALATAPMESALAIIRVSGEDSFTLLRKIFSEKGQYEGNKIYFGNIVDDKEIIDEVLVSTFIKPRSYTGENLFEISCHGGMFIVGRILSLCLKNGARMAEKGEFSKRAYLNSKIDLLQAEAINDMIKSTSEQESSLAILSLKGKTSKLIAQLEESLIKLITNIEVNIDYPEYDEAEIVTKEYTKEKLLLLIKKIDELVQESKIGQMIKDGIKVAIVGKPNVGKSSLLNALIEEEKAIVTSEAGTTRDIVEGNINIDGLKINLYDTAGIRNDAGFIEKIGIEKAKKAIEDSDLVILVFDLSAPLQEEDYNLLKITENKLRIVALNKADLEDKFYYNEGIKISAKNNKISDLKEEIKKKVGFNYPNYKNKPLLTNARQIGLLKLAKENLTKALNDVVRGVPVDLANIEIVNALTNIEDILGNKAKIDISEEIFARFCLGK